MECFRKYSLLVIFQKYTSILKIKIYGTVIFPVVLYGYEAWSLILRKEHRLGKIFGPRRGHGDKEVEKNI